MRVRLALAAVMWAGAVAHGAVVELREQAEVNGARIELGSVAAVSGTEEETARLEALDLGPSPQPGGERSLSLGYLKMRLRRWGVADKDVSFTGASSVQVRRPAAIIEVTRQQAAPGGTDDAESPQLPSPVVVARGSLVRLAVICGAVRIVAGATTLEDGAVGGVTRMRVTQTRQTVWAELISPTEATLSQ